MSADELDQFRDSSPPNDALGAALDELCNEPRKTSAGPEPNSAARIRRAFDEGTLQIRRDPYTQNSAFKFADTWERPILMAMELIGPLTFVGWIVLCCLRHSWVILPFAIPIGLLHVYRRAKLQLPAIAILVWGITMGPWWVWQGAIAWYIAELGDAVRVEFAEHILTKRASNHNWVAEVLLREGVIRIRDGKPETVSSDAAVSR